MVPKLRSSHFTPASWTGFFRFSHSYLDSIVVDLLILRATLSLILYTFLHLLHVVKLFRLDIDQPLQLISSVVC